MIDDYIWYASYGSNLSRERFLCYIKGGVPKYTAKKYSGCLDKADPIEERPITLFYELYFAKSSPTWCGSAVAFIKSRKSDSVTLGRCYLITVIQLIGIACQENNKSVSNNEYYKNEFVKYILTHERSFLNPRDPSDSIGAPSWYGKLFRIGKEDGKLIFTLTATWSDNYSDYEKPNEYYLRTMANGLRETYNLNVNETVNYFVEKMGIKEQICIEQLKKMVS